MLRPVLLVVVGSLLATSLFAQAAAPKIDFPAASPAATVKQRVGLTDVEISYSRPSMKGRTIFGGLVPYDQVWRTGANTATNITFSTAVKLNGTTVPAGKYELFSIPGKTEWTVIIHKDMSQWGAYTYDAKNDVARVKVTPVTYPVSVESFAIGLADLRDESATLYLLWDKTRVPVKLEVEVASIIVPQIEAAMAGEGKKPYGQAAIFYLEHNLDLKKAAAWMDISIVENPKFAFYSTYHKARILAKMGDKEGALAAARKSIELASKEVGSVKDEYIRLNEALIASVSAPANAKVKIETP